MKRDPPDVYLSIVLKSAGVIQGMSPSQYSALSLSGVDPDTIEKLFFIGLTSQCLGISPIHSIPLSFISLAIVTHRPLR